MKPVLAQWAPGSLSLTQQHTFFVVCFGKHQPAETRVFIKGLLKMDGALITHTREECFELLFKCKQGGITAETKQLILLK